MQGENARPSFRPLWTADTDHTLPDMQTGMFPVRKTFNAPLIHFILHL